MLYLTSDFHISHNNIHKYCSRHSRDNKEYIDGLFHYLSFLKPQDSLLFLGDLACGIEKTKAECYRYLSKLQCKKHFIRGNHDYWLTDADILELGFASVQDYIWVDDLLVCHYPFDRPFDSRVFHGRQDFKYLWDLFYTNTSIKRIYCGHTHNQDPKCKDFKERVNCSVDRNKNFYNIILPNKEDSLKILDCLS